MHPYPENRRRYTYPVTGYSYLYCQACKREQRQRRGAPVGPDEMVIERLVAGDSPETIYAKERRAAALKLRAEGRSIREVAEAVRCTPRNVSWIYRTSRERGELRDPPRQLKERPR
jgi:hypothetical protein